MIWMRLRRIEDDEYRGVVARLPWENGEFIVRRIAFRIFGRQFGFYRFSHEWDKFRLVQEKHRRGRSQCCKTPEILRIAYSGPRLWWQMIKYQGWRKWMSKI